MSHQSGLDLLMAPLQLFVLLRYDYAGIAYKNDFIRGIPGKGLSDITEAAACWAIAKHDSIAPTACSTLAAESPDTKAES